MRPRIATVTLVVKDYDAAIAWFVGKLGFNLLEDAVIGADKRWVRVAPEGGGAALLLARAVGDAQRTAVGAQAGGRVAFFLETDDIRRDHSRFQANGVRFRESPREEPYGTVAVFEDLCGNPWDLIEPR
ncbi:MAG: VOC family protein [Pseudomonadota bacterium]